MAYPSDLVRTKNWGNEILTDADLEGQLDLIINWVDALADETSGHKHDGTSNEGPKIATLAATVTGNTTFSGTLTDSNGHSGGFVPAGTIVLWSGAVSAIPTGWVICDGNNSTPNLTDRFVIHADADSGGTNDVGDTGGSHSVTLTEDQIPAHTHTYDALSGGSGVGNGGNSNVNADGDTTGSTGGGNSHENRPKFYALAYIMKT